MRLPPYYYTPVTDPEAIIQAEYTVERRDGSQVQVNRFDFNLLSCTAEGRERVMQCSDMGWTRVGAMRIVVVAKQAHQ